MSIIRKTKGFSLIEVMLVIVILSMIAVFALRMQGPQFREAMVNHSAAQIKEVMEAATSYYIDNGQWPMSPQLNPAQYPQSYPALSAATIYNLTSPSGTAKAVYLPYTILKQGTQDFMSPFGVAYLAGPDPTQTYEGPGDTATIFEVQVDTQDPQIATLLRSKLPLASIAAGAGGANTLVTAYINIPSYDYNHAKALSDIGVYHPGDCIPLPSYVCPRGMQAANFVTLEQAYGFGVPVTSPSGGDDTTVYPITSSSVYIKPGTDAEGNPQPADPCPEAEILPGTQEGDPPTPANAPCTIPGEDRVCVAIGTTNGQVTFDTGRLNDTYVIAMTKCVPKN